MPTSPVAVVSLYTAAFLSFWGAVCLRRDNSAPIHHPLARGLQRGEIAPGIPRLDPGDYMANAAVLRMALNEVGTPGLDEKDCHASPRSFSVLLGGRLSHVRFGARAVCQLRRLKQISVGQASHTRQRRGLGEMAAFVLGRRLDASSEVDVTRIVVPPFRFTGDSVSLVDVDLGPLLEHEQLIGTWHTHPDGDLEEGVLSKTDLHFIRYGWVDFHGQVGALRGPSGAKRDLDWLFDIVEPRDGDWNVYAHDRDRLEELRQACETESMCPLDELRLTGSRYYLFTRFFDERSIFDDG
jgi:hypothetical protein